VSCNWVKWRRWVRRWSDFVLLGLISITNFLFYLFMRKVGVGEMPQTIKNAKTKVFTSFIHSFSNLIKFRLLSKHSDNIFLLNIFICFKDFYSKNWNKFFWNRLNRQSLYKEWIWSKWIWVQSLFLFDFDLILIFFTIWIDYKKDNLYSLQVHEHKMFFYYMDLKDNYVEV